MSFRHGIVLSCPAICRNSNDDPYDTRVYHRTLLGVLAERGVQIQAVAMWLRIPIRNLRRLAEFGAPLDAAVAERLIAWGTRIEEVSRPRQAAEQLEKFGRSMSPPKPSPLREPRKHRRWTRPAIPLIAETLADL